MRLTRLPLSGRGAPTILRSVRIRRAAPLLLAAVAVGISPLRDAVACSLCGCGDPLVDASDSVPQGGRFRLALDVEFVTGSAATEEDPAATESVDQVTIRPVLVYSPTEWLNLILQVPLVRKAWSLNGSADAQSATNTGLGDIDVGARWFFLPIRDFAAQSRQNFGLSAGVTLPTGPNAASEDGMRLDDHAQLGTGSFGPYLGLVYAYHQDPWNLFASLTARTHTTSSYGYRYGTALQWTARVDYRPIERLALEAGIDGRHAWRDALDGEAQENTGGLVLSAAPGASVNVFGDVWLRGRIQIPFVKVLNGDQTVGVTLFASVQFLVP
jgi:hypothetical protein